MLETFRRRWWLAIAILANFPIPESQAAKNGLGAKPYLGWSSWSLQCTKYPGYGGQDWLTAQHVKQQSAAMAAKLQKHGYTYINMDSGWRGGWDEWGRPTASTSRFPLGIRDMAEYVHAKGQKLGIYYVPGIDDDLLELNPPIKGTPYRIRDIVLQPRRVANGWGGGHAIDFSKPGAHEYIQSIADLFASWEIDFLKFDGVTPGSEHNDLSIDSRPDVAAWSKALIATGRPIWLTVSWKIDMRFNDFWRQYANAIRTGQDVESYDEKLTHWPQISWRFKDARDYGSTAGRGNWNDLDSLLVGNGEMSSLTHDERRTAMTIWAIACSPLYSGDDLTKLDDFGLELLTNDEVIAVQQSGNPARQFGGDSQQSSQIWTAKNADGSMTVALFNLDDEKTREITLRWKEIGMNAPLGIRDLWDHRNLKVGNEKFETTLAPHACRLLRLIPADLQPR